MNTWFALDRIKSVTEEYEHTIDDQTIAENAGTYLFFADYSIWIWAWAISCGEGKDRGRIVVFFSADRVVADNFAQFVDRFIEDSFQLG